MIIRCWGARGSIPVSGKEYVRYGGSTTCVEIRADDGSIVIVDAGTGIRGLGNALLKEQRRQYTLLFTHAHWDHLMGFPFFRPIYRDDCSITIYGCPLEDGGMRKLLAGLMSPPYFPVPLNEIRASIDWMESCVPGTVTGIGSLSVSSIPINHPNRGLGYKFVEKGRTFVFLTDNELEGTHPGGASYDEYVAFCKGADLLFHDAEFLDAEYAHTRGWGHSTWRKALQLAMDAGVAQFGLIHHNQERTDDAMDEIVVSCRSILLSQGVSMHCFGARQGMEIDLS